MKNFVCFFIAAVIMSSTVYSNDGGRMRTFGQGIIDSVDQSQHPVLNEGKGLFNGRKSTAVIYSLIIPGSGQTWLGSPYKGFGFTFVAFGCGLTTLISHNNFVASNERLDALEFQYKTSTTWEYSNLIYTSMIESHSKMVKYKKMRNSFAVISAVVWSLNIADLLFNTDDEGEVIFSSISVTDSPVLVAGGIVDQQKRLTFSIPLD